MDVLQLVAPAGDPKAKQMLNTFFSRDRLKMLAPQATTKENPNILVNYVGGAYASNLIVHNIFSKSYKKYKEI